MSTGDRKSSPAGSFGRVFRRVFGLPYLPVLLAPFILFLPIWLAGKALFWGTPFLQFLPWWNYAWESLRSGYLPLWDPQLGMGAPLIANYQSALFYPPNWLNFGLAAAGGLPAMAWGQALLVALHLAWAGLGMILLARRLGLGVLAQTISGLAFGLSGYLVSRAGFFSITSAVAWLPWILFFTPSLINWRVGSFIGLVLCLAMQLLAGHAQTTWYTWLLVVFWVGYWSWIDAYRHDIRKRGQILAAMGRAWLRLAMALVLAFCLTAVQLLPTLEYLGQSQRASAVNYEQAMTYSFWPWRLLTLLAPDLFGNPVEGNFWGYGNYWEDALYVGVLPFLLAFAAMWKFWTGKPRERVPPNHDIAFTPPNHKPPLMGKQPAAVFFLSLLLPMAIILALGKNTPLFPWLYRHVPTFAMFQAPARYMIWAEFALALLAGLGAEKWRRPQKRALYWTRLGTAGAIAITLGAGLAWLLMARTQFLPAIALSFIRATALAGLWALGAGVLSLTAPGASIQAASTNIKGLEDRSPWWSWAVALFVAADLLYAGWGLNPGAALSLYRDKPASITQVQELADGHRLYLPEADEQALKFMRFFRFDTFFPPGGWADLRAVLLPDSTLFDAISSANNFDPLVPSRYARWMQALAGLDDQNRARLLDLMDVRVEEHVDPDQPLQVRFDGRASSPARWRFVACARLAQDPEQAWQQVLAGGVDFERQVVLESPVGSNATDCNVAASAVLKQTGASPNFLSLRLSAASSGWLVLSDVWYPGWQARVDGLLVPILHADYLFRAVQVTAGEHVVTFTYRPRSFWLGVCLSLLAWIALASILIKHRSHRMGHSKRSPITPVVGRSQESCSLRPTSDSIGSKEEIDQVYK